jgi:sulfotransferase famil protein
MIISHKYKYIFIHVNKTAGTSIEIALSKFCGPDDIITPHSPEDEIKRKEFGGIGPQNYKKTMQQFTIREIKDFLLGRGWPELFRKHISAKKIKSIVSKEIWETYFKFCVERNPWDRVVSAYFWKTKDIENPPSFSELIRSERFNLKKRGYENYTLDGNIVVDRILKFENLQTELNDVAQKLGIGKTLPLPHTKHYTRPAGLNYRDCYNDEDTQYIANLFADEIEYFGYTF